MDETPRRCQSHVPVSKAMLRIHSAKPCCWRKKTIENGVPIMMNRGNTNVGSKASSTLRAGNEQAMPCKMSTTVNNVAVISEKPTNGSSSPPVSTKKQDRKTGSQ